MTYTGRLGICAALSLASHFVLARGSASLPPRVEPPKPVILRVALRQPEPEPEPEPERKESPEARKPLPTPTPRRVRVATEAERQNPTKNVTPTERPDPTPAAGDTPVFGISMESTTSAGAGPAMRVGNTLQTKPRQHDKNDDGHGDIGLAAPVPAYEVTKMPLPKGECGGRYTDEAREAGLEGVVILTFVVDENGRVRDVKVLQGLGMGLTEAAKRAALACLFSPGERNGKPVPTRVPTFKVRFSLREDE